MSSNTSRMAGPGHWQQMTDDELFGIDSSATTEPMPMSATDSTMQIEPTTPRYITATPNQYGTDRAANNELGIQQIDPSMDVDTDMTDVQPDAVGDIDSIREPGGGQTSGMHAQEQDAAGYSQASANREQQAMPPPAVPRSFLRSFKPSPQAVQPTESASDPAITSRLVSQVVHLYRAGKFETAGMLAQYTVDLIGQGTYDRELAYFDDPPFPETNLPLSEAILQGTADLIQAFDQNSSERLFSVLDKMDFGHDRDDEAAG